MEHLTPSSASRSSTLRRSLGLLILAALLVGSFSAIPARSAPGDAVVAEGSASLYPPTVSAPAGFVPARANNEWRTSGYGPGGFLKRRTLLQVFAKAGEYILLGSSAVGVAAAGGMTDQSDVLIYNPGVVTGKVGQEIIGPLGAAIADPAKPGAFQNGFSCQAQRAITGSAGQGRIASREQELAGPDTILNIATLQRGNIADSYLPCFYQVPATGMYAIAFWGPLGGNSDTEINPTGKIDGAGSANNFTVQQGTSVAAWNVSVRPQLNAPETKSGRLWTSYLTLFTGGNDRPVFSPLFAVADTGYIYHIDLNAIDPNGFLLYGSQLGFLDTDGAPLYRDVLASPAASNQNQLTSVQGGVNLTEPTFKLFFNNPDPEALTFAGVSLTPTVPNLKSLRFEGKLSGNISKVGEGGTFFLDTTADGVYELVLSRDGTDFDPTNRNNAVLRGLKLTPGEIAIPWDGRDNKGDLFPVGNYETYSQVRGGEFHFPMLDVENSLVGGPTLTLVNTPTNTLISPAQRTIAYYDDRSYFTRSGNYVGAMNGATPDYNGPLCNGDVGSPPVPPRSGLNGFDSRTNQRAYGDLNLANLGNAGIICSPQGSFGDTKGLDIWTYVPGNKAAAEVVIVDGINPPIPPPDRPVDLAVVKKVDRPLVPLNENLVYTIEATNLGPNDEPSAIVTDVLPAGLALVSAAATTGFFDPATSIWTIGVLPVKKTETLQITARVTDPSRKTNTAVISGKRRDTNPNNNRSTVVVNVPRVDLAILKRANSPAVSADGSISYTLVYTNIGQLATTGTIITDTVPANTKFDAILAAPTVWSCPNNSPAGTLCTTNVGTLAVGAHGQVKFAARLVLPLPPGVTQITNIADIGDDGKHGPDVDPSNNRSRAVVPTGPTAIGLVSFTATNVAGGVELQWTTAAELNTRGFYLYRSTDGTRANAVRITPTLIASQGRGGASYSWLDTQAPSGAASYWLQEVETDGTLNDYGPVRASTTVTPGANRIYIPLLRR